MNVIPPLTITDAILTSSTVPEAVAATYSGATTYAAGALAGLVSVYGSPQLVYRSKADGNLNNPLPVVPATTTAWWEYAGTVYPAYNSGSSCGLGGIVSSVGTDVHLLYESLVNPNTGNPLSDTTKWLASGPTNKWAMFDLLRNTATIAPLILTNVLTPATRVDSICLAGMVNVTTAVVTVVSSAVTVYTSTTDLTNREVLDWYDYYFLTFSTQPTLALFDLPPYTNAIITVTLSVATGNVECGACVLGSYVYIGDVQYEAESDVLNFSTVTRDFAGGTALMVQRRNVPKTIQQIMVAKNRVNKIRLLRDALAGTPAVWSALTDSTHDYFDAFLIIGFYKKFSINARHPEHATISLELEEI